MTNSNTIKSGGIKPLNAPRVVHVRTNSTGSPTSIQVPPTINSPKGRRRQRRQNTSVPRRTTRPNQPTAHNLSEKVQMAPPSLVSDGKWMRVVEIENLWKVNDEWWRGPEEEIARLYYVVRLTNGQQLTVYLDLITNNWYRQAG
ncbi:MAG TPA: hypothetical protein EYG09_08705 [Dehalococcoidia bacterium]|nr:hypothetical protein [Dehalococcoidia bacterium]